MSIFHKSQSQKHKVITALLVGSGVVFFWRGIWGLADVLLFPGNPLASHVVSLLLGIFILSATHYLVKELM